MINGVGRIGEGVPKRYTRGEEIVNSITHGIGSALAVAGTAVLIVFAVIYSNAWGVVGASIFGASMIILYTMSTLYHAITNRKAKKFFRIMDHNTIFFLIAGTYTPITLVPLRGALGWVLFGLVWGAAVLGIVLNSINLEKFKKPSIFCYIIMGWVAILAIIPLAHALQDLGTMWLVLGGGLYTLGCVFYLWTSLPYSHTAWHLFVLAGTICHFFCLLWYVMA